MKSRDEKVHLWKTALLLGVCCAVIAALLLSRIDRRAGPEASLPDNGPWDAYCEIEDCAQFPLGYTAYLTPHGVYYQPLPLLIEKPDRFRKVVERSKKTPINPSDIDAGRKRLETLPREVAQFNGKYKTAHGPPISARGSIRQFQHLSGSARRGGCRRARIFEAVAAYHKGWIQMAQATRRGLSGKRTLPVQQQGACQCGPRELRR